MADPSIISFHFSPPSQPPGSSQALPPTCLDLYPYDSTRYAGNLSNFANFLHSTFDISWHSARARSLALHSQSYCQHVLLRYTYRFVRHTVALLVPCSTPEPIIDTRSPRFSTGDSIIPRVLRQPLLVSICSLAAHSGVAGACVEASASFPTAQDQMLLRERDGLWRRLSIHRYIRMPFYLL